MENSKKVREQVKMSRNLYLRVMQRIVYFSLMIVTIVMRKLVEKILGFKIRRINLDRNLIEHEQEGWVSWIVGWLVVKKSSVTKRNPITKFSYIYFLQR
jgi:hypothetical protein